MKIFIALTLQVLLLSGCATDSLTKTKDFSSETEKCWATLKAANGNNDQLNQYLDQEIYGYQELIEAVLV